MSKECPQVATYHIPKPSPPNIHVCIACVCMCMYMYARVSIYTFEIVFILVRETSVFTSVKMCSVSICVRWAGLTSRSVVKQLTRKFCPQSKRFIKDKGC